jgi:hypothetical protein
VTTSAIGAMALMLRASTPNVMAKARPMENCGLSGAIGAGIASVIGYFLSARLFEHASDRLGGCPLLLGAQQ